MDSTVNIRITVSENGTENDTSYYDIFAQDTEWDATVGRGSYCVHVARIACGLRSEPNLTVASRRAQELLAQDKRAERYFEIVTGSRIAAVVRRPVLKEA